MSLETDGFWSAGFWATTFWAEGFWREGEVAARPDVVPIVTHASLEVETGHSRDLITNTGLSLIKTGVIQ